jgi:hypothetical protein
VAERSPRERPGCETVEVGEGEVRKVADGEGSGSALARDAPASLATPERPEVEVGEARGDGGASGLAEEPAARAPAEESGTDTHEDETGGTDASPLTRERRRATHRAMHRAAADCGRTEPMGGETLRLSQAMAEGDAAPEASGAPAKEWRGVGSRPDVSWTCGGSRGSARPTAAAICALRPVPLGGC